jgi:hypothetical protein
VRDGGWLLMDSCACERKADKFCSISSPSFPSSPLTSLALLPAITRSPPLTDTGPSPGTRSPSSAILAILPE